jgi:hypothetical protein
MPNSGSQRLYELLDALLALRMGFADGADGDKALVALGRAKVLEVRTMLDAAIHSTKRIIREVGRPPPPK